MVHEREAAHNEEQTKRTSHGDQIMNPDEFKIDPFGILVGHTWMEVGLILDFINTARITRFVEIGVHKGGLCAILAHTTEHLSFFHYLGIEINPDIIHESVKKLFHPKLEERDIRQLVIADALQPSTIKIVSRWVHRSAGPALVYCDGGDKPKEFERYAPVIRAGDFIAAHDWDYGGYDRAEIKPSDVEEIAIEQNLIGVGFVAPYRIALWRKVQ